MTRQSGLEDLLMIKFFLPLIVGAAVALTACSSANYNKDEVPNIAPDAMYSVAQNAMASGDFQRAKQYLEAIDSRYPFGELADQVQLDLIYVYYKMRDSEKTSAQINRFMRLNPTSQYTDYVMYMTGLNQIQMRSDILQDFIGLNRSQKDPTQYYEALKTFRNLIETYPESKYAADAHQRMIFIKQQLAEREMAIANYYYERGSYLSTIRHCQNILYSYRGTQYLEPALALMVRCYDDLGLPEAAANARSVQEASFGTTSFTAPE